MRQKFNALAVGAVLAAVVASQATAADPPLFTVNDNSVSYATRFSATDPFVTDHTQKNVITFTHFDAWAYGTNFFNIDLLKSDIKDPANPCGLPGFPATGCEGTTEIYGFFRSTLGFKELFGWRFGSFLTNISFKVGGDANSVNNANAAAKKDVVAGLQFNFALPYGATFNFAPLFYSEKNHSSFILVNNLFGGPGGTPIAGPVSGTDYFQTWRVEGALNVPLGPKGTPLSFGSLFGINGPKGTCPGGACGTVNGVPTKTEYFTQQSITLDVGQLAYGKPNLFSIFVAYVYWQNKFGIDHNLDPTGGTTESTALLGGTLRF